MKKLLFSPFAVFMFLVMCSKSTFAQTIIAKDGKALMPITISADANDKRHEQAKTLAEYVQKISGASFEIHEGDSARGIVIGTVDEFPALASQFEITPEARYVLTSSILLCCFQDDVEVHDYPLGAA